MVNEFAVTLMGNSESQEIVIYNYSLIVFCELGKRFLGVMRSWRYRITPAKIGRSMNVFTVIMVLFGRKIK